MSDALTTRSADESKRNIFLVGRVEHQIVGAKLPSKRQVLQVFFFHMRFRGLNKRKSARMVLREVQLFWQKARINMSQESWCIEKIEKMYNTWDGIRKHADRDTETQKRAEDSFVDGLDDLFDFAHADALNKMRNQEDRAFLLLQRQKGRPGSMIGVDVVLTHREQRTAIRKEAEENRKRKYDEMMQAIDATLPADEVDEPEADFHVPSDVALRESTHMEDLPVVKRGRKHFIDARLAGALDQAKITDGMSIHVLIAMAKALFSVGLLNCSVEELVINRSSVRRQRIAYREDESRKIQAEFIENVN